MLTTHSVQPDSMRYTYNSNGQIIMLDRKVFLGGVPKYDTVWFSYPNDTTHNFSSSINRNTNGQLSPHPMLYTYDSKPLPLAIPMNVPFSLSGGAGLISTDNNIVNAVSNGLDVLNYEYTYNDAGYPEVQTFALRAIPRLTWTFTYHCVTIAP